MSDEAIRKRTKETANKLFGKGIQLNPPYLMWKEFDKDLANDFSKFITGNLYSRTVLTLPERQMAACAMLAAIRAGDELKLHVNAALNVGCDPKNSQKSFFSLLPMLVCLRLMKRLKFIGRFSKRGMNGRSNNKVGLRSNPFLS